MVSYKRHIAKTISWRIIGTIDTIILSGIITGSWELGLTIGGIEIITKMVLDRDPRSGYVYRSPLGLRLFIIRKVSLIEPCMPQHCVV